MARIPSALGPDAREAAIEAMTSEGELDVLVVGGGVVGAGTALDAVTRGLNTGLLEQRDLASGTSSRSSKLIHGGLRYLEMLDFGLVREALEERGLLLTRLAPHLVRPVPFLYPLTHRGWERPYVGAGLALYDAMAMLGKYDMGVPRHRHLFRRQVARIAPDFKSDAIAGAIRYYDCQVDDARLVMTVARTAAGHGAQVATRVKVVGFLREGERVVGRPRPRPRERPRPRGAGPRRDQRGRGVDRRDPGDGRRPRRAARAGEQGHPPGGAARPDPLRGRLHRAHRDLGAVRDPVGPALDHRHHRHGLGPRQGASGGEPCGHRLRARARQQAAPRAAGPRRRRGRLRRPAAAAHRRVRADLADLPRAHGRHPGARAGDDRGRQAHDVPGDGEGRGRRRGALADHDRQPDDPRLDHRPGAAAGRRRLRDPVQPAGAAVSALGAARGPDRPPARPVRRAGRRPARADQGATRSWPRRWPAPRTT